MSRILERHVSQQRIRYHAIPRFVVESIKLQPRSFPHNLPTEPHRPPSETSRPPALRLGSIRGLKDEKKDSDTSQQPSGVPPPIKDQIREKKEKVYQKEMQACDEAVVKEELVVLPKHEQNADLVRYRAVRYEPEPEIWQTVACTWDQLQSRPNQFYQYESDKLFPAIYTSTTRLEEPEKTSSVKKVDEPIRTPRMEISETNKMRFTRPTPGYGGYISRYPVEPRPPQGSWDEVFVNFSKLTYRSYPSYEYTKKEFAHKGPLCRLVTTTHPSNPFNS
ncbi:hypothetical protein ABFA07_012221 [Porites harrisoni]